MTRVWKVIQSLTGIRNPRGPFPCLAFVRLARLGNVALLTHPDSEASTRVVVDASDVALGATLQQQIAQQWCPLSFFRRSCN